MKQRKPSEALRKKLECYLHSHEEIKDSLKEVWVARYDRSWVILTNERIIIAVRRIFEYKFTDYSLENLDIDLTLGLPFDTIEMEAEGKKYTGHFYSFRRERNLSFLKKIKEEIKKTKNKGKGETKEKKEESEKCKPVETIKELAELKKTGIITGEEFEKKKKKLLKDI